MPTWARRHDGQGQTTFISYSPRAIEMLLPPGSAMADRERDAQLAGATPADGLWTWARWPRTEETIVDHDRPARMEPISTFEVLGAVGRTLHADVHELMREQLRYASTLTVSVPLRGVDERRAHEHAPLLMALAGEYREAFPGIDIWDSVDVSTDPSDDWDDLLDDDPHATAPSPHESIAALAADLVRAAWALTRAISGRVSFTSLPTGGTSVGQGPKRSEGGGDRVSGPLAAKS